ARKSIKLCGDLLECAVTAAHSLGLEFFGIFKVFDMGFNRRFFDKRAENLVKDIEEKYVWVMPELVQHQEFTMHANPAWIKAPEFPVTTLYLYSEKHIPDIQLKDVKIWVSRNNHKYSPYQKKFKVRTYVKFLPHCRWSPAGRIDEYQKGKRKNYVFEISNLEITVPFVAIEIKKQNVVLENFFYLIAAYKDKTGSEFSLVPATGGDLESGFVFNKTDYHWVNQTEGILSKVELKCGLIGFTFKRANKLPTLLEPSFAGTRAIWLSRVERILASGAEGVDIRILCHHNNCVEWLTYAFAESVREYFKKMYGREPKADEKDYEKIRKIRGGFFTDFLRDTRKMANKFNKKISVHFEPGIEVEPEVDTKMQIHWDWQTWLKERLMDEIHLKYWSSQNPWIHCNVLPMARKMGIPIYIEDQATDPRADIRAIEMIENIVKDARVAGFDGYIFYETWTYMILNRRGIPVPRGNAEGIIKTAYQIIQGSLK
ncbi:MAG TPA: hypothetical protein PLP13_06900, partial [bacterium]|nr:hypothetical protein [bacterium]